MSYQNALVLEMVENGEHHPPGLLMFFKLI